MKLTTHCCSCSHFSRACMCSLRLSACATQGQRWSRERWLFYFVLFFYPCTVAGYFLTLASRRGRPILIACRREGGGRTRVGQGPARSDGAKDRTVTWIALLMYSNVSQGQANMG